MALNAVEVMIQLVHVGNSIKLANQTFNILVLIVHVADEPTIWYVIFWLLFVLEWLTRIHVKAVDFFFLSLGLIHADLINLATETLASG